MLQVLKVLLDLQWPAGLARSTGAQGADAGDLWWDSTGAQGHQGLQGAQRLIWDSITGPQGVTMENMVLLILEILKVQLCMMDLNIATWI